MWVGLDVGKGEHFADVLDNDGERLFARAVANGQADLEALLDRAARHGTPGLVIDQPGSIAQLALAVAARRGVPGLVMRRAADLYPGEAKTDRRDAYVLADTGRTRRKQVHWLDTGSDDLQAQLRVLNGLDIDLAADGVSQRADCLVGVGGGEVGMHTNVAEVIAKVRLHVAAGQRVHWMPGLPQDAGAAGLKLVAAGRWVLAADGTCLVGVGRSTTGHAHCSSAGPVAVAGTNQNPVPGTDRRLGC